MLDVKEILNHEQLLLDLTGYTPEEFQELLPDFEAELKKKKMKEYEKDPDRARKPGGGRRGHLKTIPEKLFFIALYYHVHPTYKVLQKLFGYSKGSARKRVRALRPVYENALGKKLKVPRTRVNKLKTFFEKYPEAVTVFSGIDNETYRKQKEERKKAKKRDSYIFTDNVVVESSAQPTMPSLPKQNEEPRSDGKRWTRPDVGKGSDDEDIFKKPLSEVIKEGGGSLDGPSDNEVSLEKEAREARKKTKEEEKPEVEEKPEEKEDEKSSSKKENIPTKKKEKEEEEKSSEPQQQKQREKPKKEPTAQEKLVQKVSHNLEKAQGETEEAKSEDEDTEVQVQRQFSKRLVEVQQKVNKQLEKPSEELSIIEFVDAIIQEGYFSRASDVHIEPEEKRVVVRLRIDGVLHDTITYPKVIHSAVITRIKVVAGLRTDEHQAAQDGRFKAPIPDVGYVDIRVSIAPTYYGENSVMRILTQQQEFTLEEIGIEDEDLERVKRAARRPYGMILSCGPTGSGKTTTLYSIIKLLNTRDVSIITIEDPIEYSISGIDQIQVNRKTGLSFAEGLRALLRQDPDIIMVGEIRDEETAGIAVNAALTGHRLLSTLHTNDAATALPRLADMGIEPFLVASTVNVIVGQRLVRRICKDCKENYELTDENIRDLTRLVDIELLKGNRTFYRGAGCEQCGHSGYKGRVGIFEVLEMEENIKKLIMSRASSDDIKYVAIKNGMSTMLEDGIKKAIEGITTIEEVLRVAKE